MKTQHMLTLILISITACTDTMEDLSMDSAELGVDDPSSSVATEPGSPAPAICQEPFPVDDGIGTCTMSFRGGQEVVDGCTYEAVKGKPDTYTFTWKAHCDCGWAGENSCSGVGLGCDDQTTTAPLEDVTYEQPTTDPERACKIPPLRIVEGEPPGGICHNVCNRDDAFPEYVPSEIQCCRARKTLDDDDDKTTSTSPE